MAAKEKAYEEIYDAVVDFIINTPIALITMAISLFSGYLWLFIFITYFKIDKKAKKFLDGNIGRVAIGLLWFSLVMIPVYFFMNDYSLNIEIDKLLNSLVNTILFGLALQAIIFGLILKGGKNV